MKHTLLSLVLVLTFSFSAFAAECVSGDCDNGYGTYLYDDGNKYVGENKNGLSHGQGTFIFANGNKYVGEFKNNNFSGQGTFTWKVSEWKGNKYVGEWKNNKFHGQGTYTHADGTTDSGIWENHTLVEASEQVEVNTQQTNTDSDVRCVSGDCSNGQGTWTDTDGDKYVGEWKNNKFHGQGTYTYADGDKYIGEFKDGKPHGKGTYTYLKKFDKYVGEWKNNKKHGLGTYTYGIGSQSNGDKYVGEWKNNKFHGQGTYTHADGLTVSGTWENGEIASKEDSCSNIKNTTKEKIYKDLFFGMTKDYLRNLAKCRYGLFMDDKTIKNFTPIYRYKLFNLEGYQTTTYVYFNSSNKVERIDAVFYLDTHPLFTHSSSIKGINEFKENLLKGEKYKLLSEPSKREIEKFNTYDSNEEVLRDIFEVVGTKRIIMLETKRMINVNYKNSIIGSIIYLDRKTSDAYLLAKEEGNKQLDMNDF